MKPIIALCCGMAAGLLASTSVAQIIDQRGATPSASEREAVRRGESEVLGADTRPRTQTAPYWTTRYTPDLAYVNNTAGRVNVRTGPGANYARVGQLRPREGGFIQNCNQSLDWCQISYGGQGGAGWVYMPLLSAYAS